MTSLSQVWVKRYFMGKSIWCGKYLFFIYFHFPGVANIYFLYFSIFLLCMHVFKGLLRCKSVCDVKPGLDPCPLLARSWDRWWLDFVSFIAYKKVKIKFKKAKCVSNRCNDLFKRKKYFGFRCTLILILVLSPPAAGHINWWLWLLLSSKFPFVFLKLSWKCNWTSSPSAESRKFGFMAHLRGTAETCLTLIFDY